MEKDWLTVIIILLMVGIALDGLRRMRKARHENLRLSANAKKADMDSDPSVSSSEFPSGGARVASYREENEAKNLNKTVRETFVAKRVTKGAPQRIPQQVALNLQESVPMLMDSVELEEKNQGDHTAEDESNLHAYEAAGYADAGGDETEHASDTESYFATKDDVRAAYSDEEDDESVDDYGRVDSDDHDSSPSYQYENDDVDEDQYEEEDTSRDSVSSKLRGDYQHGNHQQDNHQQGSHQQDHRDDFRDKFEENHREPALGDFSDLDDDTDSLHEVSQARPVTSQYDSSAASRNTSTASRSSGPNAEKPKPAKPAAKSRPEPEPEEDERMYKEPDEVLIMNIMAKPGYRFDGETLLQALMDEELKLGAMDIFHRHMNNDGDAPVLFSLANMVVPGTFNLSEMKNFQTPGISMFLSLPVEGESLAAYNDLARTARSLAEKLDGELKDENRSVMTNQTIEHGRQRVIEYERKRKLARA